MLFLKGWDAQQVNYINVNYKNLTPVQHNPRNIPVAIKDDINSELDQMIKPGVCGDVTNS